MIAEYRRFRGGVRNQMVPPRDRFVFDGIFLKADHKF